MNQPLDVQPARYHLVMSSFDGTDTAANVLRRLRAEHAFAGCEIEGEALVSRDVSGEVHYHERGAAGVGAAFGAATAGIVGLVGGPVILLLMLAVGGVAGGVAGHLAGQVLPREDLRAVGESLPPGSSAYLALVDAAHAGCVAGNFEAEGARILNVPIELELSCAIREAVTGSIRRV